MSAFSVQNPHDGKTFENDTQFEWGVEVSVVTTFMLRLFVPHEFDMALFQVLRGILIFFARCQYVALFLSRREIYMTFIFHDRFINHCLFDNKML